MLLNLVVVLRVAEYSTLKIAGRAIATSYQKQEASNMICVSVIISVHKYHSLLLCIIRQPTRQFLVSFPIQYQHHFS